MSEPEASGQARQDRKIRVAVVFGGKGPEHAVSCMGGGNMLSSIDRSKYDVVPVGITREGSWVQVADEPARLAVTGGQLPTVEAVAEPGGAVVPWGGSGVVASAPGRIPHLLGEVDVVLPVLHGPFGEDGTIQGLLELADVRYVGCGVLASAVGMDKHYMKLVFAGHGLPVGPYVVIGPRDWEQRQTEVVARVSKELTFPVFVKPARAGSSLGVTRVDDVSGLVEAVEEARFHDPKVLVEQQLAGREIECAVLGGRGGTAPRASVPGEIVVDHASADFYDFEEKYSTESHARTQAPADLPDEVAAAVRDLAVRAFEAIGGEGISRVDVFVSPEGEVVINEINTMPGFTPISMYPKMWEATGLSYPELIDELIQLALERPTGLR